MTHKATLTQSGSTEKLSDSATLADAIEQHCVREKASFHTPGHKGGTHFKCGQNLWAMDVTELPGLDELAYASGVLARVQEKAAQAWHARASFISTNGASAALMAAIIACAPRGKYILIPRNAHRSSINALVLTGLEPLWYEPQFDAAWSVWGEVCPESLAGLLEKHHQELAAALVVSPTYAGSISDVRALQSACRKWNVPLILDQAHGAHLAPPLVADVTVHSLHKTLSAMTQTGIVHVAQNSLLSDDDLRLALNMVQSSSPNYILMASVESAINEYIDGTRVKQSGEIAAKARQQLELTGVNIYTCAAADQLHLMVSLDGMAPDELFAQLTADGIYPEAILGNGVLLLFGCGSTSSDVQPLLNAMSQLAGRRGTKTERAGSHQPLELSQQVLSPRLAYFGRTEVIPLADAVGRIAAECVAPCPPGNPVVVPGQRVTEAAMGFCNRPSLRVVVESQQGEQ